MTKLCSLLLALTACASSEPRTPVFLTAAAQQAHVVTRPLPRDDEPQTYRFDGGSFPLATLRNAYARDGTPLRIITRGLEPDTPAWLWVSQPIEPVDVGLPMLLYAIPTVELRAVGHAWMITPRLEWGWTALQAVAYQDGEWLLSDALAIYTGEPIRWP